MNQREKHVMQVMQNAGRGSGQVLDHFTDLFHTLGFKVTVAGAQPEAALNIDDQFRVQLDELPLPIHHYLPNNANTRVVRDMEPDEFEQYAARYEATIEEAINKTKPRLIIGHHLNLSTVAAHRAAERHSIPVAPYIHGTDVLHFDRYHPYVQKEILNTMHSSPLVIINSPDYHTTGPTAELPDSQRAFIPPPVDTYLFGMKENKTRELLQTPPTALFVGALIEEKGVDLILEAAKYNPGVQFNFIGAGALEPKINLPNTRHLGKIPNRDLPPHYQNATISIAPSKFPEAWGLTITEAQSTGTPVITTDKGGPAVIVENNKTGILFNTTASDADKVLSEHINSLLMKPRDELLSMGQAARERTVENFSTTAINEQITHQLKSRNLI